MALYKRGKVWWMAFTYDGRQVRRSTEMTDKKLAERIQAKVMTQVIEGKFFDKPLGEDKTFREMMEKYDREWFSTLSSGTTRGSRCYLEGLVRHFGDYGLTEIRPRHVNEFKQIRKAQGRKPATINRQINIMKRAFNIAVKEWEWLEVNPIANVSLERENNARDRWLSNEEERRLIRACPDWIREIVIFALNTGMRLGEILSLTHRGVEMNRRTVTVFKSKNGEKRTIPANNNLMELLEQKKKVRSMKTDYVFYTENHTAYHTSNFRRDFVKALKRAGIEDFRFHDLRHTFATRLVQGGIDIYKVGRLLGHKDIRMTQRYAHHCPESLRDGVEILDRPQILSQFYHNSAN